MSSPHEQKIRRKQRRKQAIEGMLTGSPLIGPHTAHFDIANACNTRCTTCWDHSPFLHPSRVPSALWKRKQLPFERFCEVFDDLVELGGLEQIILSGMGEPFLNPSIYDMVAYAHQHEVGVTIITNVLLIDQERLFKTQGELNLLTSICGVTDEVWQAFHAHPKPRGFQELIGQLEGFATRNFKPKHVQVINKQNFHQLVDMVRFGRRYPVKRINFKFASLLNGTEAVAMSPQQKSELLHDLIPRAQAFAHAYKIDTDLEAFATQVNPDSHSTAPIADIGCFMGYVYTRITVEGEVLYCCNTEVSVGHLGLDTRMRDLWEGDAWQSLRDDMRQGNYKKGCEQCGKYKQNYKWHHRLKQSVGTEKVHEIIGL